MTIQYAEFEDLADILSRSNHETTYTDLMQKEKNVLDTVNAVVKHYQQKKSEAETFTSMQLSDMVFNFATDMSAMFRELIATSTQKKVDYAKVFTQGHRLIYIGIVLIFVAFLIAISR